MAPPLTTRYAPEARTADDSAAVFYKMNFETLSRTSYF